MNVDCRPLEDIVSFDSYISTLRNVTAQQLSADSMQSCRQEVCTALYGTGSSDVSGIGVLVGYFLELILAALLAITLLVLNQRKNDRLLDSCRKITGAYVDSAIALALSVELACAIMLIKKNFGLGADEFGGLTVQTVWIVATLVMLPIVSFCWRNLGDEKSELRLCMTALAFILFLITFICRMISTYSDRQVGSTSDAVVTNDEAWQLEVLCFGGSANLSPAGSMVVEVFSVGASLWISCNIVLVLIDQCLSGSGQSAIARAWQRLTRALKSDISGTAISVSALILWSTPLFWALLSLRSRQKMFATSINQASGGDVWTFGQIIAVIVFLPVLNESLHQYLERSKSSRGNGGQQDALIHLMRDSPKSSSV